MEIANIAAATDLVNKEIETSVQAIFLDATLVVAGTFAASSTLAEIKSIVEDVFGTAALTISKQTPSGTEPIQQVIKLIDIAEMSTNNEGVIRVDINNDDTVRIRTTVELSLSGAFKGGDNSKLLLSITGHNTNSVIKVRALDLPFPADTCLTYRTQFVNQLTDKDIDCVNTSVIAFPIDELATLRAYYHNGKQIQFTQEELKQRLFDSQDTVVTCNGRAYYGYMNLACFNVEGCWKVTLNLATSQKIYLVQTVIA